MIETRSQTAQRPGQASWQGRQASGQRPTGGRGDSRAPAGRTRADRPVAAPARPPARPGGSRAGAGKVDLARWAATEDARLLWLLRTILSMKSLRLRIVFLALGFTAIGPLALAYAELLPLPVGGRFILLPAATTVLAVGMRHTAWGRRALVGYIAGFVATGIYDCLRLSLTAAGLFPGDPIPGIGRLLLNDPDASWIWGYAWRFLGNGAGMGMAFAMLPWRGWKFGVAYGATICTGLFVVLAVFPPAQEHFFPLEVGVGIGAMLGHWVYGGVLGWLCTRYLPPVRWAPSAAGASDTNVAAAAPGRAAHGGRQAPGYQAPGYQAQGPTRQSGAGRGSGQYQRAGAGGREPAGPRTGQHPVTGAPPRQRTGQYPAVNGKQYPAVNGNGRGTSGQYPAAPAAATTGNGNGNGRANGNGNGRANDNGNGRANGNGNGRANGNGNGRANGNGHATSNGNGNGRRSGASGPYSAEFPVVTPGSVPPSAISGPIPVVPGVPGNGRGPGAGRSGQFPAVPGGRDFPALPPGTVPPSAISGPIPAIPANGPAPRPQQRQTSQSGQQRVVPSRAQRHPPKEPKPW